MGKLEAIQKLKTSLNIAIGTWVDLVCETEEWGSLNAYIGENLSALMGNAAISVLEGIVDIQEYLKKEQIDFTDF